MSVEKVKQYLKQYGLDTAVRELDDSSATVELAAKALGCEGARIAKSLSFDVNGTPVIIVCAGDAKVDNAAFKREFGVKARMMKPDQTEEMTGHAPGGVCPFALNENVRVYLDASLKRFDTVYPACGSSNSCILLTIEQLETAAPYQKWIDVCKGWEHQ